MVDEKEYKESPEQLAVELAEKLYEDMFNELMTALKNSIKNFEGAMWSSCDGPTIAYYQGKMHAFKELSERLVKEYYLVLNNQLHNDNVCYQMMLEIKERKNKELDKIFPDNKYRGTRFGDIVRRLKGKLADLLEGYGTRGFMLGLKKGRGENIEYEKFDPVEFEKLCDDTFIGEKYMYALRYMEDPEFRKEEDYKKLQKEAYGNK